MFNSNHLQAQSIAFAIIELPLTNSSLSCATLSPMVDCENLEQFFASVERRALRMTEFAVSNRDEAMDIVQDAMLKLVEKYGRRPAEQWRPLFYKILQSRIRDWYRRSKVRNSVFSWWPAADNEDPAVDVIQQLAEPSAISTERHVESDKLGPAIQQAIASLPLRQQQAFLLRAWEGLDVKQTAQAMSCSEGSVKTHYFRALHSLRELLAEFYG